MKPIIPSLIAAPQAEEVRALSTKMAAAAGEPLKEQVKRGVDGHGRERRTERLGLPVKSSELPDQGP